jgi:predicted acylesterase/phospholipase RssA
MFFRYKVEKGEYVLDDFDAVVVGGGGLKGLSFLGAIHFFKESGVLDKVETFAGTSVGAVICLLMALGYTPEDQLAMNLDASFLKMKPLSDMVKSRSLFDFSLLMEKLEEACVAKMDTSPSFRELRAFSGKSLRVVAYNASKNCQHLFSDVATPDVKVMEAVRYSCAIPLIFDTQTAENGDVFFDGGLVNNLPVDVVADDANNVLVVSTAAVPPETPTLSFADIVQIIINVPTVSSDLQRLELARASFPEKHFFHIHLKHSYRPTATLGMSLEEKTDCFRAGYDFAKRI